MEARAQVTWQTRSRTKGRLVNGRRGFFLSLVELALLITIRICEQIRAYQTELQYIVSAMRSFSPLPLPEPVATTAINSGD